MAVIGTFKRQGDVLAGEIRTLTFQVQNVTVRKVEKKGETSPDYRVFVAGADIGAAWERTAKESGTVYLSVKIDDPSLAAPINANLVQKSGDDYELIWSR